MSVRYIPEKNQRIKLRCLKNNKNITLIVTVTSIRKMNNSYIIDTITKDNRRISFTTTKKNHIKKTIKGLKVIVFDTYALNPVG